MQVRQSNQNKPVQFTTLFHHGRMQNVHTILIHHDVWANHRQFVEIRLHWDTTADNAKARTWQQLLLQTKTVLLTKF